MSQLLTISLDELTIDKNVRVVPEHLADDANFVDSIREHGILQPISVTRNDAGGYTVLAGHRRVIGAREAGLTEIPANVLDGVATDADRIVKQVIENDQRKDLTTAERSKACVQLTLAGMKVDAVAKATKTSRKFVSAAVKLNRLGADDTLVNAPVDLTVLAKALELQPPAELLTSFKESIAEYPDNSDYYLEKLRRDTVDAHTIAKATAEYEAAGHIVVAAESEVPEGFVPFDRYYQSVTATETDTAVRSTDYLTTLPAGSFVCQLLAGWEGKAYPVIVAVNPEVLAQAGFKVTKHGTSSKPAAGTEEAKEERRQTVANNKALDIANTVRRQFIKELLQRKTLPEDAPTVAANLLATTYGGCNSMREALDLLGLEGYASTVLHHYTENDPKRAVKALLAMALAATESHILKSSWRDGSHQPTGFKIALEALKAWGYASVEVEELAAVKNP